MTISLPGSSRKGAKGFFRRKTATTETVRASQKPLDRADVAKLFDKEARKAKPVRPAKLSESELSASEQLSSLRGALYSKK